MAIKLSNKLFIFNLVENDKTTKTEYLLALAKDIYCLKELVIQEIGSSNWTKSDAEIKEAERISNFYLESLKGKKNIA